MLQARRKAQPRFHPALHIDVVHDGQRVTDETLDRRRISVGTARSNAIVLYDAHAPRSLPLFLRNRDGFALHYTDDMHGRVAPTSGAPWSDLSQLTYLASTHGHAHDLALGEGARGQIEVGDETLEFEIVPGTAPVAVPHRRLMGAAAMLVVLLLGGTLTWTLFHSTPIAPDSIVTGAAATPRSDEPVTAASAPAPVLMLPGITLQGHLPTAPHARGPIEATGTLREATPMQPVLDSVAIQARQPEQLAAPSDYTADGVLKPQAVVRMLEQEVGAVRARYEHDLRKHPAIGGELVVRIRVDTDGAVGRVNVVKDTLEAPDLSRRVMALVHDWRSPSPMAAPAEYEVPFRFHAQQ